MAARRPSPKRRAVQNAIKRQIKQLCAKSIERSRDRQRKHVEYADKYTKRTGLTAGTTQFTASYPHKHFDPIYCKRNANFLAKTVWFKIQNGTYEPKPAIRFEVPKATGGTRPIMQFSIPDSAVASVLNRRLTLRNLKNQSGNSFAYRPDRNVFDAILKIKNAIKSRRNFAIQLDFENYFDSIPHTYINKLLSTREILIISDAERKAIQSFLTHRYAGKIDYANGNFKKRMIGTPQGSAISLGLANLANHPLDGELEAINGQFSRYADDTVVICYSYEDALQAYRAFVEHCDESGLKINRKKSPGIWILSSAPEEFRTINQFKFLGYGIAVDGLFMHSDVEARLRRTLSRLINLYLVHYIEKHAPNLARVGGGFDWDLIGLISEVRNILYGGLSEVDLVQFIKMGRKLPRMRGLMGFYALLDDKEALARLDGWLVSTIRQALFKRYKIIGKAKKTTTKLPNLQSLIDGNWYFGQFYNTPSFQPDARMPSFVRAWAAARKYYYAFGLEGVDPPRYVSYY
jgi:retron-type reverse transcriptase